MRTWISLFGSFEQENADFVYIGGTSDLPDRPAQAMIGNFLTNDYFGGGTISANVEFLDSINNSALQFILFYDSQRQVFITAGIDTYLLTTIRT